MSAEVDPLACALPDAHDWCARHRVPLALVHSLRRASSKSKSVRWEAQRRVFVVEGADGRDLAAHPADDPFWRALSEEDAWRAPAVALDPSASVRCECGLTVIHGADLSLHRMGVVHQERMAAQEGAAA